MKNKGATNTPASQVKNANLTATYKHIKASIVSVLMWLSFIGGLL
jgi:hypothetical protein